MIIKKHIQSILLITVLFAGGSSVVWAYNGYLTDFNNQYGTGSTALDSCTLCHPTGGYSLNNYGGDFQNGYNFSAIEEIDSDQDGFSNIDEILAATFPGDDASVPEAAPAANPPVAGAGPDQTVAQGDLVTLDASNSTDADQDIVGYLWTQTGGPAVTLSDPAAVDPTFTAPQAEGSSLTLTFQLTVTDSTDLSDTDECIVNVAWQNSPPTADAGPDQTVDAGTEVTLSGLNSSDSDNEPLVYAWIQTGGTDVTIADPQAPETIFVAPDAAPQGETLTFTLTVTDSGGLMDTDTCAININPAVAPPPNIEPIADAGADQTVTAGDIATLNAGQSSDPDGSITAYQWVQTSGTPVTLSDPTAVSPQFSAPVDAADALVLGFTLTVTDNGGLQATDTCLVNVQPVETQPIQTPPVVDAGKDQVAGPGDIVRLDGTASYDADDGIVSYLWSQTEGEPVILSDPTSPTTDFTVPADIEERVTLVFQLTATDAAGLSATDTTLVVVAGEFDRADSAHLISLVRDIMSDSSIDGKARSSLKNVEKSLMKGMAELSRNRLERADRYFTLAERTLEKVRRILPADTSVSASLDRLVTEIRAKIAQNDRDDDDGIYRKTHNREENHDGDDDRHEKTQRHERDRDHQGD